jgi:peptidoglycan hydrolase-like protein with peptidoglycan-binding domain
LAALGYDPGPIDGIAGPKTAAAVRAFQRNKDLEVDGIVGEITNKALLLALSQRLCLPLPADQELPDPPLLKNFSGGEFACGCGCGLDVVAPLKIFAQDLRDAFGWPLVISSGARCPAVNQAVGGVSDSCHLSGQAFDGYFPGRMDAAVMTAMAEFALMHGFGVIRYPRQLFCHFQVPPRNTISD